MLITSKHLEGACQDQVDLFNETFPIGAEFNKPNWDLALSVGLQVRWMEEFLDEFNQKIYKEVAESAWKIYDEATSSAYKIYDKIFISKIYDEEEPLAWGIYHEATKPAWKIYHETRTSFLFNALEEQFKRIK